jgi:transcriptional regulator NrdR family protein
MKCPNCKHDINFNKTYSDYEISAMMNGESKKIKSLLKNIIIKIKNSLPSNDNKSLISNFIVNAIMYEYKILDMAITNYMRNAYLYQGKGFKYLLKIIDTFDKDRDKIFEYEKKRYGTSPPVIIWDGIMEEQDGR